MSQFDHLSSDKFWDLVYETAKNRKKKKKLWKEILSPEYADVVRSLADNHINRIQTDIKGLEYNGFTEEDTEVQSKYRALQFIKQIKGQATHAIEKYASEQKNVRRYEKVQDAVNYAEYLKDCLEDLRSLVPDKNVDFLFFSSLEAYTQSGKEIELDEWIEYRNSRG